MLINHNFNISTTSNDMPNFFSKNFLVMGIIENNNAILLLKNNSLKDQPYKWGVPGGKPHVNEKLLTSIRREIKEETGIFFKYSEIKYLKDYFIRYFNKDYILKVFKIDIFYYPKITLSKKEHSEYIWCNIKNLFDYDLILGEKEIFKDIYNLK